MLKTKKFRAPISPIRVALTSGHVAIIGLKLAELSEQFWAEAYALGAISGDMEGSSVAEKAKAKEEEIKANALKEKEELTEVLKGLFSDPQGSLDKNGLPLTRKVSARLGRTINRPQMLKIWEELKETIEAE